MSAPIKLAAILGGGLLALLTAIALASDVPGLYVAYGMGTLVIISGTTLYIIQRFGAYLGFDFDPGPDEERIPAQRKPRIRKIYVIVALGMLLVGIPELLAPFGDKGFGVSCLLAALVSGFFAVRDRWTKKREPGLSLLNKTDTHSAPAPLDAPRTTILLIAVIALLVILGDTRRIISAKDQTDVWVGVGQILLWMPIFGYLAYREIRRMKREKQGKGEKGTGGI